MADQRSRLLLGYVRVSTVDQESGYGPDQQAHTIQKYCEQAGLGEPEIIQESRSGESTVQRHELNMLLARAEAAAESDIEVHVVFPGLDRLSRNLIDQESVVIRCQENRIRLHSALGSENDTLDPAYSDDPMRVAIRQFWGIINQLERAIIQRRMDGGLMRKAQEGGFTGGRPPFGYRSVNHELQVSPRAAEVVRRVFGLASVGVDQRSIAAIVAREHPDLCNHWHKRQVGRLLEKADLYRHGIYRPRGGAQERHRPDLVILTEGSEQDAPVEVELDWDRLPDTVPLPTLALMLNTSEDSLRLVISREGIVVRHRRGTLSVAKHQARRLSLLIKSYD